MIIKFDFKKLLLSLVIPLGVGGLSALITGKDMKMYGDVVKPPLSPPSVVFPIVWTVLYILMGVSFYIIWNGRGAYEDKKSAFTFYGVSLFLNFIWSPVFFSLKLYLAAFFILAALFITVVITIVKYRMLNKTAAYLQIPYIIWLLIAAYLNLGVYILN